MNVKAKHSRREEKKKKKNENQIENKWHAFCRLNGKLKRIDVNEANKNGQKRMWKMQLFN